MWKDDSVRMHHMLDAAREAVSFAQNKSRESLDTDRKLVLALVKSIEIIGKAAANVTNYCQASRKIILIRIDDTKINMNLKEVLSSAHRGEY